MQGFNWTGVVCSVSRTFPFVTCSRARKNGLRNSSRNNMFHDVEVMQTRD
jgi:hypothetical protein